MLYRAVKTLFLLLLTAVVVISADPAGATEEKLTISTIDISPWFTEGSNSGIAQWYPHVYDGNNYISTYVGGMPGDLYEPDCWAMFKPHLAYPGEYDVYVYFYAGIYVSTQVPFAVRHAGGTENITVNQYNSSPAWKEKHLGRWAFNAGSETYVKVTDATGEPYDGFIGLTIGTVRFVKINQPPTCSLSANPTSGIAPLTVTFSMTANDTDGSINAWVLDVDGDGQADYSGQANPLSTLSHVYNTPGPYTAALMV